MKTLVLNSDYQPHRVIDWKQAFVLIYSKDESSAMCVCTYTKIVHDSMQRSYNVPAVIVLKQFQSTNNKTATYSKYTVFLRDNYECQYCGRKYSRDKLTIDHIIPKSRAKLLPVNIKMTSFENCVTACLKCNGLKADKLLLQSNLKLRKTPRPITKANKIWLTITSGKYPPEWEPYLVWGPYSL